MAAPLPRFDPRDAADPQALVRKLVVLVRVLEKRLHKLEQPTSAYTTSNVTTSRTLDAGTATLAQLADVVGTMIQDDQERGRRA